MDNDGPFVLAGAICFLAAERHSKDAGHQEQMAAAFYENCKTEFTGIRIDKAVEAFVLDLIKGVKGK